MSVLCAGYNGHGQFCNSLYDPVAYLHTQVPGYKIQNGPTRFTLMPGLGSPDEALAGYNNIITVTGGRTESAGGGWLGQLVDGSYSIFKLKLGPTRLTTVKQLVSREGGGVGITVAGQVVTFGGNIWGTLGNGHTRDGKELGLHEKGEPWDKTNVPYEPEWPTGKFETVQVAGGVKNCAAVLSDGRSLGWGFGKQGVIGDGTFTDKLVPTFCHLDAKVIQVACGGQHKLLLTDQGEVYGVGFGGQGQLADETLQSHSLPVLIPLDERAIGVAAGGARSFVITERGDLIGFGDILEVSQTRAYHEECCKPKTLLEKVKSVSAGGVNHDLIVKTDGELWSRGANGFGQLGIGTKMRTRLPVNVGIYVKSASAGFHMSVVTQ